MSRLAKLTNQPLDPIVNAENDHERKSLNMRLSPLAEFIIENLQVKLGVSFTRAGSELLEAAAIDWLEANGHEMESPKFKKVYLEWLNSFEYANFVHPDEVDLTNDPDAVAYRRQVVL
jgi:hypothetical protein